MYNLPIRLNLVICTACDGIPVYYFTKYCTIHVNNIKLVPYAELEQTTFTFRFFFFPYIFSNFLFTAFCLFCLLLLCPPKILITGCFYRNAALYKGEADSYLQYQMYFKFPLLSQRRRSRCRQYKKSCLNSAPTTARVLFMISSHLCCSHTPS